MRLYLVLLIQFTLFLTSSEAIAKSKVINPENIIQQNSQLALESILIKHQQTTGEAISVVISNKDHSDKNLLNNSSTQKEALLILTPNNNKVKFHFNYLFEANHKSNSIEKKIDDFYLDAIKNYRPSDAIVLTVTTLLKLIESPLVLTGKANEILLKNNVKLTPQKNSLFGSIISWLLFLICSLFFAFVIYGVLFPQIHYNSNKFKKLYFYDYIKLHIGSLIAKSTPEESNLESHYGYW